MEMGSNTYVFVYSDGGNKQNLCRSGAYILLGETMSK